MHPTMDPEKIREARLAEARRYLAKADTRQKRLVFAKLLNKIMNLDASELIQAENQIRKLYGGVKYGES